VTQTFHRYFRQQISLEDALAAPRVYPDADTLLLEAHPGLLWKPTEIEFLDKKGQAYKRIESPARFGRVHGIALDTLTNKWKAAADPDWEGTAKD
jgi:gamma-glutamyltranspeptidase